MVLILNSNKFFLSCHTHGLVGHAKSSVSFSKLMEIFVRAKSLKYILTIVANDTPCLCVLCVLWTQVFTSKTNSAALLFRLHNHDCAKHEKSRGHLV